MYIRNSLSSVGRGVFLSLSNRVTSHRKFWSWDDSQKYKKITPPCLDHYLYLFCFVSFRFVLTLVIFRLLSSPRVLFLLFVGIEWVIPSPRFPCHSIVRYLISSRCYKNNILKKKYDCIPPLQKPPRGMYPPFPIPLPLPAGDSGSTVAAVLYGVPHFFYF